MVDTGPLEKYIKSRDALKAGDKETALALLAESVGAEAPTPYMKGTLKELMEPNQAILTILLHKSKGDPDG